MANIIQWNLQSYQTKFNDLKILLNKYIPACVCLQETMLREKIARPPSKYQIVQSIPARQDGHERSVAILIHNKVSFQPIQLNTELQAVAVRLHLDKSYTICSLYLPHIPANKTEIEQLIAQLPPPYLILGDMNAKSTLWNMPNTDERGAIFENILLQQRISLLNDGSPTHYHVQTDSYSTIDLSLCSSDILQDFKYNVLEYRYGSDHFPIKLDLYENNNLIDTCDRFNIEKANWSEFRELTQTNIKVENFNNIDNLIATIVAIIITAATASIPTKTGGKGRPTVPWFNDDCKKAIKERRKAERNLKRRYTENNKIEYKRAKAKCRYIFQTAKKNSWKQYISSINSRISLHEIWKKVQKISGRFKSTPTPALRNTAGEIITNKQQVAQTLAESFAAVSHRDKYPNKFRKYASLTEKIPLKFNTRSANEISYNEKFTQREFNSAMMATTESSPGQDKITYSMIKNCHPTLQNVILNSYNKIYTEQVFPNDWRNALVIPILKPRKNPYDTTSYRPISLTCCICKLMEKMINNRMIWSLEQKGIISPLQSGFRKSRSTIDNLLLLENDIQYNLNTNQHTIAIFFDIKKAYDMSWRRGILQTLYDNGYRGNLPEFIKNFLTNRTISVCIGETKSTPVVVPEGIPQGSVLSCTLFLLAMNSITDNLPRFVKANIYVDDYMIYTSSHVPQIAERRLQLALNSIEAWSDKSGLSFSTEKTVSMHICRRRGCPKTAHNFTLDKKNIQCVDQYKYLGMHIDNGFTWKQQINSLRTSCMKTLELFKHISHKRWGADRASLLRLYIMLMKPKLDYGCEIYSSASQSLLDKLPPIQNAVIRLSTGAFRSSPILSLTAESGIKPLTTYREIKILNTYARIISNPSHPLHELYVTEFEEDEENEEVSKHHSFLDRARTLYKILNISFDNIMEEANPQYALWNINVESCNDLYEIPKKMITAAAMKKIYERHDTTSHINTIDIYTDGTKCEEGVAYAYLHGETTFSQRIQSCASIFTAELYAIYSSLNYVAELQNKPVTIHCDSRSAIMAITKYPAKNPLVQRIQSRIKAIKRNITLCWVPSHVGVIMNERADDAAREGLQQAITPQPIPRSDFKILIKKLCTDRWRQRWQNIDYRSNKYREISDNITPLQNSISPNRQWETTLCRLRIGHSTLTHGFLMEKGNVPYCQECIVPLTIKHILIECPSYAQERRRYLGENPTMTTVLNGPNTDLNGPLKEYLTHIGIIKSI